ncbi:MAG: sugar ABC transporter substrate-binding protein [Anaerolineae bacterium]|nr:sugar ABC transporter substrate-binding protein [Anaerolineae bacterium]
MGTIRLTRRQALRGMLAIGGGAALMTACSGTTSTVSTTGTAAETPAAGEPAAAAEAIALRLMAWEGGIGNTKEINEITLPAFMDHNPTIKVKFEAPPWDEYWTKFQTLAASGDLPDVYSESIAYGWDHANQGIALNLQPFIDATLNTDDYYMEMHLNGLRYPSMLHGDLYAFPVRWVGALLFYNKDIFDAVGAAYPDDTWTYDDMLNAAQTLTKVEGGKTVQWGMDPLVTDMLLDPMIKANGGSVVSDDYRRCTITEPVAIESIQWSVDTIQTHKVAPSPATKKGFAQGTFASQVVAMAVSGSWDCDTWREADFAWDVTYIPKGKVSRKMGDGPDSLGIYKASTNKEAAWKLVEYWVSEENQMRMGELPLGCVPFLRKAAESPAFLDRPGSPSGLRALLDMAPDSTSDYGPQWMEWRATIMRNELDLAFLGERSVEESVQAACVGVDQVLASIEWPD